ncbi:Sugar transporter family protein [Sporothrix schenckii 1099-18]|uniref:Sugar transporter family protein n=1 Tax=Sporothrix schenckii 1099-18 TaxID=1397361 RepID=A0A0F2M3H0_SPOSC|nr:Sugar transporter family protein [Sporothrix schenckii 1099-18]KJR83315.1 Sugar transporter family protein [Sporothrix schenckii 1099-18]
MATDSTKPLPEDDIVHETKSRGSAVAGGEGAVASEALAEAIRREHELTFRDAVRLYPAAIGWSAFVSIGVIMLAFDPQILGGFFATPRFEQDFGYQYGPDGDYIISAPWQSGLSLGNPIGQVFGALFASYPMDRFGRKRTFGACVVLTGGLVFIQFFSRALSTLLVGELLGGLVLGCYVVIAPAYASEVCPLALRGHLTSYVNLCFVIGQLLGSGVTAATENLDSRWSYSIPFALQWFWVAVILPGLFFVPESPWWLVRQGRTADAEAVLRRLAASKSASASASVDIAAALAVITETDRLEQALEAGSTYRDCFRGVNLRRTEIATGVYCTQVLSGIYMINFITVFFSHGGLSTTTAFDMSIGFLATGFVGTLVSWFLILRWGRRTLFVAGLVGLAVLMFLVAILDCVPRPASGGDRLDWAEAAMLLVWNFVYDLSIGPVCFVIISECSATRVRAKSIAVSTAAQGILGIVMTVAIPYLINPDQADARGKVGFFFGGLTLFCLAWTYFRVPETAGRTYEELDLLFDQRVPARQFKGYQLDRLAGE